MAWKEVNWPLVDSRIIRYQTRIFKASSDNNIPKVRCLQKRLLRSLAAKLLAVRRVTTLNKGKKTPGVGKQVFVTDQQNRNLHTVNSENRGEKYEKKTVKVFLLSIIL